MKYHDALSYFSPGFEDRVADPAELGRQLYEHRMENEYIREAIVQLGEVAQFKARARKLASRPMGTLAGQTAIEFLFAVGGRTSWGELALHVRRQHKMAGHRNERVLEQLESAGVLAVTYRAGGRDGVIVSLAYDLWLPAEVVEYVDREQLEAEARAEYEASRTTAVAAGLELVRKNGGSMAAEPAPGPGFGPQPSKIAHLVAWAMLRGSHSVQAEFDRYGEASERLAKIATGQVTVSRGRFYYTGPFGVADTSRPFEVAS